MQVEIIVPAKPLGMTIAKHPLMASAVEVKYVYPGSHAEKSGVLAGDIVKTINGGNVYPMPSKIPSPQLLPSFAILTFIPVKVRSVSSKQCRHQLGLCFFALVSMEHLQTAFGLQCRTCHRTKTTVFSTLVPRQPRVKSVPHKQEEELRTVIMQQVTPQGIAQAITKNRFYS
jgi:hypothetical protein